MATNFSENSEKINDDFYCKNCDYNCSRLQHWKQHISTKKHKKLIFNNVANSVNNTTIYFECGCGKAYKDRSGLWRHKKHCNQEEGMPYIDANTKLTPELVFNQIQVSLSDLEETGKIGYAEGISKVFIKNLNEIDYTDRPIHCSDAKRETLYIKEDNKWSKDDDQKSNLTKAIKQVANKNIKQISEWQKLHPDFSNPDSKQSDKYMQIVLNSMSGSTKEESDKNYEKIAKNVIKEVLIEK